MALDIGQGLKLQPGADGKLHLLMVKEPTAPNTSQGGAVKKVSKKKPAVKPPSKPPTPWKKQQPPSRLKQQSRQPIDSNNRNVIPSRTTADVSSTRGGTGVTGGENTITLTQAQLEAIIASVSKITAGNVSAEDLVTEPTPEQDDTSAPGSDDDSGVDDTHDQRDGSAGQRNPPPVYDGVNRSPQTQATPTTALDLSSTIPKPLTLVEKKKAEWDRQIAEQQGLRGERFLNTGRDVSQSVSEWFPFGRPGCGAPMTQDDEYLKFQTHGQNSSWQPDPVVKEMDPPQKRVGGQQKKGGRKGKGERPQSKSAPVRPSVIDSNTNTDIISADNNTQFTTLPTTLPQPNTLQQLYVESVTGTSRRHPANIPPAMRTNLVMGDPPTIDQGLPAKELERKQWLFELAQQREDQRLRKQQEKQYFNSGTPDDESRWAQHFKPTTEYQPLPVTGGTGVIQQQQQQHQHPQQQQQQQSAQATLQQLYLTQPGQFVEGTSVPPMPTQLPLQVRQFYQHYC